MTSRRKVSDASDIGDPSLNPTLSGVKVDLIRYGYPLLEPLVQADGYTLLAKDTHIPVKHTVVLFP